MKHPLSRQQMWSGEGSARAAGSGQPVAAQPGAVTRPLPKDALIVIPLRNAVLFPGVLSPMTVGRPISVGAAQEVVKRELRAGFLLQRDPEKADVVPSDLYWVGTAGPIVRYITGPEGTHHLVVQGESRFRVLEFLEGWPFLVARVAMIEQPPAEGPEVEARFLQLKERAIEAIGLLPHVPDELVGVVRGIESASVLADIVANLIDAKNEEKQDILETFDLVRRLDKVIALLSARIEVLKLSKEIGEKTRAQFDERQREHVLREQLRQIQKELGEGEENAADLEELSKAIEGAGMPAEVLKHAEKEFKRLQRSGEGGAEYSMLRTYLEWLTELPWKPAPQQPIDLAEARRVLDEDHFDLEKIKRRILEYLAVRKLNPEGKSPILCFVGPPGVGKTSLGQSIARATGRVFQRVALGGVHDEAEIRGHRRTYIGALPGNIIQAMRRAGTTHAVLMLDEIDKTGAGQRAAGGARSGAEPQVSRQLPGGGLRPVARDVHLHGERARHDSGAAARPDGDHSAARIHRGGEDRDRAALPGEAPARCQRPEARTGEPHGRSPGGHRARLHARSGRAQPGARDRLDAAPRGDANRGGAGAACRGGCAGPGVNPGSAQLRERAGAAHERARRGHGAGLDAGGRRHPVHRGQQGAWQWPADPDGTAGRRDEGIGPGCADAGQDMDGRIAREDRCARARSGRRDAEGRAQRGCGDVPGAAVPADGQTGALGCGHDG